MREVFNKLNKAGSYTELSALSCLGSGSDRSLALDTAEKKNATIIRGRYAGIYDLYIF